MGCEAQLQTIIIIIIGLKTPIHARFLHGAILSRKVSQTDLTMACHWGSLVGLCNARLQVSVCSGYDLVNYIQTHRQHFDQLI